jgi:4-amino-4-deoxy-L-arabinose transferase-like glycosyltransferase
LTAAAIAVVALIGLLLRLWIPGRQPMTSSTVIPGLMAHEILRGHFFAFYWGQNYGGVEPYVVAAVFALFGQSSFTLGLTPVLLDVVAVVLVWRIGRRLFGPRIALGAALLFWIWPEVYIYDSTLEYGFRFVTLVCGLAVMLLSLRIAQRDEPYINAGPDSFQAVRSQSKSSVVPYLDWLALGFFAGVGWWGSPEICYYLIPSAVFLLWRHLKGRIRFRPELVVLSIAGAVVGALPWLWNNLHSHLGSLRKVPPQPDDSYLAHLSTFFKHTLPIVLGLRLRANYVLDQLAWVPGSGRFLVGPSGPRWVAVIGMIAYAAALVGILVWIVVLIRQRRALVVVGAALLYPFVFALSPFGWDWRDGRYGLFLAPVLCLLVASGLVTAFQRRGKAPLALPLAIAAALGLTLNAVVQLHPYTPVQGNPSLSGWFTWTANPNPGAVYLTKSLESAHLDDVWAGYSISWLVNWQSGGRVTASDMRYANQDYYNTVAGAKDPSWLFIVPGKADSAAALLDIDPRVLNPACLISDQSLCLDPATFETFLTQERIGYRTLLIGPFVAIVPSRRVPEEALAALQRPIPSNEALNNLGRPSA